MEQSFIVQAAQIASEAYKYKATLDFAACMSLLFVTAAIVGLLIWLQYRD